MSISKYLLAYAMLFGPPILFLRRTRHQGKHTIRTIKLIKHKQNPRYSGEVLITRIDGLDFRALISEISLKSADNAAQANQ